MLETTISQKSLASDGSIKSVCPGEQVRAFRQGLGETQQIFGERIGLAKSKVSELEKSGKASSAVALAIESLSDFTIDAADLSAVVTKARSGFVRCGQYQTAQLMAQAAAHR